MTTQEKLIVAAARDYPNTEILVSFPDDWQHVHSFKRGQTPLYIAGFPPSQEQTRGDQFFGLPAEVNRSLTSYRLYKLFEPWPQPIIPVAWDTSRGVGRVLEGGRLRVQLQPVGQAQIWKGQTQAILWECYFSQTRRGGVNWLAELATFWQTVENDLGVSKIFTQPHEPTFEEGYSDFLRRLGYAPDPDFERWWSKKQ
jgi:hypothetical protein